MNRAVLKDRAKNVLSKGYWIAVLGCFIFSLLIGETSSNFSSTITLAQYEDSVTPIVERIGFTQDSTLPFFAAAIGFFAALGLLLVFNVFFVNPLIVGKANFFLKARKDNYKAESVLEIFRGEAYVNALKTMFMKNLIVFLGSLLIIPGIYFAYAYYFVPQIVAEDPSINWRDALAKSKEMTNGHKFELFILELSFLGWYLLGALVIVGAYLVNPYLEATIAEAYAELKGEPEFSNDEFSFDNNDFTI
ncbi:MAG: DUF975 family protein [Clostridia bacterium]|nr:DUF975 family protein [Clostridia bacterium]